MALIQTFIPNYRTSDGMCLQIITHSIQKAAIQRESGAPGHQIICNVHAGALVDVSRNNCIRDTLPAVDFVLFIDDDMKPEPEAINKIVALNKPIASALCTTRTVPVHLALKTWNEERREFLAWDSYAPTRPIEGALGVGAAFLCIRMDALREVVGYYLSAHDWLEWNRPMLDRMKVRAEYREQERQRKSELRHKSYSESGYLRVFEQETHDGSEKKIGEDLVFCWRAIQCGIPITVDPTIRVGHKGDKDYYVEDFIPPSHLKNFPQTAESLGIADLLPA